MPKPEDRIHESGSTRGAIKELLRTGLLTGLGAALLTRERIQQVMDTMVQEGKVTTDEARRMTDELVDKGRDEFSELQKKIQENVHKGLHEMEIVTRDEHAAFQARLDKLEQTQQAMDIRMAALEGTMSKQSTTKEDEN